MVSNKVLVGRRGGVIRGNGFSKYRETRTHASHRERERGRERERRGAVTIRFEAKVSPSSRATSISVRTYVRTYVRTTRVCACARVYTCTCPRLAGLLDAEGKDTAGRGHH